jgi:hypothetical protein
MLGFTVTLTDADTNYNVLALVRAISSTFVDVGDFVVQGDDDGGSQIYRLGGPATTDLDDTTFGATLLAGDFSAHYKALRTLWARCDEAGKKLNIQVIR